MRLDIRDGSAHDAAAVEAVHYASRDAAYRGRVPGWPVEEPDRAGRVQRWRKWLSDPGIISLIGEVNGKIVGFCTVRPATDSGADPKVVAEMPTLYIHPLWWRRGYGKALCDEALDRVSALGFKELTLWVVDTNTEAHDFYIAQGFRDDLRTKVDAGVRGETVHAYRYRIVLNDR